jgi:Nucleotidyl transferase AbiEii toxin, Type IV TA system
VTSFLQLPAGERREALAVAAGASGRPSHLLEKDVYVVWALEVLFGTTPFAPHLVFKGGTSLSKGYQIIRRFSEDVDITYDIREIAPDLIEKTGELLPASRSQSKVWTETINTRLRTWVEKEVAPRIITALDAQKLAACVRTEAEKLYIEYDPLVTGTGYVPPTVRLDFGARTTGEPAESRTIVCDAAPHLRDLTFPTAGVRVMLPERTFWEKATAIHVFCLSGEFRGGPRFARHWYDIVWIDRGGYAARAIAGRALALDVAHHKAIFFRENDANGKVIDYEAAVSGHLKLVPESKALERLEDDYKRMIDDRLLIDQPEPLERLLAHCADIAAHANRNVTR